MKKILTDKGQFNFYPKKIWELEISHSSKLILICLYSYADKNGYCYPSYSNLSKRTNYSRAIIAKALKELESLELLRKETKFNNRYWLKNLTSLENELVQKLNCISLETEPILVQKLNCNYTKELNQITKPSVDGQATQVELATLKKEPKKTLAYLNKNKDIYENFEKLWSKYPRKVGKHKALQAYKKIKDVTFEELKKAIDLYTEELDRNNTEEKYIKHGSTFFNGGYLDYVVKNNKNSSFGFFASEGK